MRREDHVQEDTSAQQKAKKLGGDLISRPFPVDYGQDYVDNFKVFIRFTIGQAERSRALDIICRPWAPHNEPEKGAIKSQKLSSWIREVDEGPLKCKARREEEIVLEKRINLINTDLLVGLPTGHRSYGAAGTRKYDIKVLRFLKRPWLYSMFVKGFMLQ